MPDYVFICILIMIGFAVVIFLAPHISYFLLKRFIRKSADEFMNMDQVDLIKMDNSILLEEQDYLLNVLEDCWSQWCYRTKVHGEDKWTDGGLSTLEDIKNTLEEHKRIDPVTGFFKVDQDVCSCDKCGCVDDLENGLCGKCWDERYLMDISKGGHSTPSD
jgi:hypothetical protein